MELKDSWPSLTQVVPLSLDFYVAIVISACFFSLCLVEFFTILLSC